VAVLAFFRIHVGHSFKYFFFPAASTFAISNNEVTTTTTPRLASPPSDSDALPLPSANEYSVTSVYVCSRRTVSPRVAPIGGLASALFTCLIFASRPVTRRSASQLVDALPEALAGPPVGRISDLLFRQREQLRYRSQLKVP